MPTGRPDYWYGTALYFEDSPADGEVTRGPTSNWAHDHAANANAHHTPTGGGDIDHADITNVLTSQHHVRYADSEAVAAVEAIVDDTPVDGAVNQPVSSNWAHDHKADASAHQTKYDEKLVTALEINKTSPTDEIVDLDTYAAVGGAWTSNIRRAAGTNGNMWFRLFGSGTLFFWVGNDWRFAILPGGGVDYCWDDTPTNGQTKKGVTSDWAYDHVNNANAHHTPPPVFVDRGDVAAYDKAVGNFTADNAWHDWDLSAIVGAGVRLVLLHLSLQNNSAGENMGFRENLNSNTHNVDWNVVIVENLDQQYNVIVLTDAVGKIEYLLSNGATWATINAVVRGWWV